MYTETGLPVNTEWGYFDGARLDPGGADELPQVPFDFRGLADYSRRPLPVNTEFGFWDGAALDPGGADELPDPPYLRDRGLGASQTTGAIIGTVSSIGAGVTGALLAGTAAAGPVGAAIAGVGVLLMAIFGGRSGAQKVAATKIADQVEAALKQNVEAYLGSARTASDQAAALQNFDYAWSGMLQGCSDPQLGDAGKRCISEREAGGVAPWCPTSDHRGCDWFTLYRNPIAQDTPRPDAIDQAAGSVVSSIESFFAPAAAGGSSLARWLPWALGGLALWAVVSE